MVLEQILNDLSDVTTNELPSAALNAAKENWSDFYPVFERIANEFINDDTSLTEDQQSVLFYGTLLAAEVKHKPFFPLVLKIFSRSDMFLTPIEAVYGDTITELTGSIFYMLADGDAQALSDYIVGDHEAMYVKASAIDAVFVQYEAGDITQSVLNEHIKRWLAAFLVVPNLTHGFLLSTLAHLCVKYQLDEFKAEFIALCDKSVFDEGCFSAKEVKEWQYDNEKKVIESGLISTAFNVVDTLSNWSISVATESDFIQPLANESEFADLMSDNGLLANMIYDEDFILANSVPVSETKKVGRNDPCPCGSGKKYKKCCL